MPFQDGFFDVYETLKKEFMKEFDFSNANDEGNPQNIMKDVIQPIYEADIVLADLTGLNPNVMYELGVAHSFNKKTIVITQDDPNTSPFDLKQYRAKYYNTHFLKFSELIEYLQKTLKGAIDNTVSFGNPVMDFLNTEHIDYAGLFKLREENPSMEIGEAGFIDFLADIETDTSEFSNSIQAIVNDIRVMNTSINNTISEINRVNKTGGSGTASFIRKEVKKASSAIDTFSSKLRTNNSDLLNLWDKLEKNILGLIENPFASQDSNKSKTIEYILSLQSLKKAAAISGTAINGMKASTSSILGIERSLTQSAKSLISDLDTYINFIERLDESIEKITYKSKSIFGDIETYSTPENGDSTQWQ